MKLLTDKTIQYLKDNNIDGILEIVQTENGRRPFRRVGQVVRKLRPDLLRRR